MESTRGGDLLTSERIRVAVADDSFLVREAVGEILGTLEEVDLVATCNDGEMLLDAVERERPDVVVSDIRMPPSGETEGLRVAARLRETHPEVGVVVLSQYAEAEYGMELMDPTAEGRAYLLKERVHNRGELLSAIQAVAHGGSVLDPAIVRMLLDARRQHHDSPLVDLTPREREVLSEMAEGKSNAAIATSLTLTKRAVEKHVGSIFDKLDLPAEQVVSRRVAAVLLYLSDQSAEG